MTLSQCVAGRDGGTTKGWKEGEKGRDERRIKSLAELQKDGEMEGIIMERLMEEKQTKSKTIY